MMNSITTSQKRVPQVGAVSIFVVIFAALLMTVITVGFVRLMLADQQRATNDDLSQSAYDSALTGVEDAKRALLRYQNECQTKTSTECDALRLQLTTSECNSSVYLGGVINPAITADPEKLSGTNGEVRIQQSTTGSDSQLNQAYTCVLMDLETPDYIGDVAKNQSALIPLQWSSKSAPAGFNKVTIEWFSNKDLGDETAVDLPAEVGSAAQPLLAQSAWPVTRPSLLRTSLLQFGSNFTVKDFDAVTASGESNANSLFLYPTRNGIENTGFTARDPREPLDQIVPAGTETPVPTRCTSTVSGDEDAYACKITLDVPNPVNGGDRTAYLRLTSLYNAAHFRVSMFNDATLVKFSDVQAKIDSTGRANDLFRRVVSRVDLRDTSFPYPEAALDIGGNLCKNFAVTDSEAIGTEACTP